MDKTVKRERKKLRLKLVLKTEADMNLPEGTITLCNPLTPMAKKEFHLGDSNLSSAEKLHIQEVIERDQYERQLIHRDFVVRSRDLIKTFKEMETFKHRYQLTDTCARCLRRYGANFNVCYMCYCLVCERCQINPWLERLKAQRRGFIQKCAHSIKYLFGAEGHDSIQGDWLCRACIVARKMALLKHQFDADENDCTTYKTDANFRFFENNRLSFGIERAYQEMMVELKTHKKREAAMTSAKQNIAFPNNNL